MKTITLKTGPSGFTAITAFFALLAVVPLVNALSISQSELAPSANVIASSASTVVGSGNVQYNHTANQDRFGGITFSLSETANLGAVTVRVSGYNYGAQNITPETTAAFSVSIVTFNQNVLGATQQTTVNEPAESWSNPPESPTLYTTVYSETVTMPSALGVNQFLTFTFSTPVSLKADTTYGIVFHWLDGTAGNTINFAQGNLSGSSQNFRTTWQKDSGASGPVTNYSTLIEPTNTRELIFVLQSSIPEPATNAAILGITVLSGIIVYRVRFRSS